MLLRPIFLFAVSSLRDKTIALVPLGTSNNRYALAKASIPDVQLTSIRTRTYRTPFCLTVESRTNKCVDPRPNLRLRMVRTHLDVSLPVHPVSLSPQGE